MTLYMLDTDTCIHIMRNKPSTVESRFESSTKGTLCISMVTLGELAFGVSKYRFPTEAREIVDDFTDRLAVLPWDHQAAWQFGTLRYYLERRGTNIGILDTMIASHALSLGATVVTNNVRHFERVPNLRIETWAVPDYPESNGANA